MILKMKERLPHRSSQSNVHKSGNAENFPVFGAAEYDQNPNPVEQRSERSVISDMTASEEGEGSLSDGERQML